MPLLEIDAFDLQHAKPFFSFSNRNCLTEYFNQKVVVRIPTTFSNRLANRSLEHLHITLAFQSGFCPFSPLFFDEETGIMITPYIEQSAECSLEDPTVLMDLLKTLRSLHQSNLSFSESFTPLNRINALIATIQEQGAELSPSLFQCISLLRKQDRKIDHSLFAQVPCHNDPTPQNIFYINQRLTLIDWETAGLHDPMWDLAQIHYFTPCFSVEKLIDLYGSESPELDLAKLHYFQPLLIVGMAAWAEAQLTFEEEHPNLNKKTLKQLAQSSLEQAKMVLESANYQEAIARLI